MSVCTFGQLASENLSVCEILNACFAELCFPMQVWNTLICKSVSTIDMLGLILEVMILSRWNLGERVLIPKQPFQD